MMSGKLSMALAAALILACAPKEDRSHLARRAVSPAPASGWARLPLDGEAQRTYPELWLGDAEGVSIPFEVEREGLWQPRELTLEHTLLGRDARNQPTAEFSLKFPEGWQVGDREHLRVDLEVEGKSPWVCRVEVDRRQKGGSWLRLERTSPLYVYDLGTGDGRRSFYIPWDAQDYRLTLAAAQGAAPKIASVKITASTRPEELEADEVLLPRVEPSAKDGTWTLRLDAAQRIVGADLLLKPPVAPVEPRMATLPEPKAQGKSASESMGDPVPVQGLVWNLPALRTQATRIAVGPVVTDALQLELPAGARLDTAKLLVHREVLLFPAEAGKTYYLHTGGRVKQAPGSLGALPDSSRAVYHQAPLKLAAAEPDPQGLPLLIEGGERTRPWLGWAAGAAVLVLGFFAWRLLKPES